MNDWEIYRCIYRSNIRPSSFLAVVSFLAVFEDTSTIPPLCVILGADLLEIGISEQVLLLDGSPSWVFPDLSFLVPVVPDDLSDILLFSHVFSPGIHDLVERIYLVEEDLDCLPHGESSLPVISRDEA